MPVPLADAFAHALQSNKHWAQKTRHENPNLLRTLAKGQSPSILWLGCADSRVPETTLLNLPPGSVFVHRNIANILPATDLNSQAVIAYAVEHLKVQHVVVCGHSGCGGVAAALGNSRLGALDTWLSPLRELRARFVRKWKAEGVSEGDMGKRLIEENVKAGVGVVRRNAEVVAGMRERGVQVHGAVFEIEEGLVREIDCGEGEEEARAREEACCLE